MSVSRSAVVLAAGQGTRMKSARIKVLHPVAGQAMVERVVRSAVAAGCDPVVVVIGHQADAVRAALQGIPQVRFAVQAEPRGTGDAVRSAAPALRGATGTVLLMPGDVPAIRPATLQRLAEGHEASGAAVTVLSMELDDPAWYGRIIRGAYGGVLRITEARDCNEAEHAIREVNTGFYAADGALLFKPDESLLDGIDTDNDQGEFLLTDILADARQRGLRADAVIHDDPAEVNGINDRRELARAEVLLYARAADHWMREGVTCQDPASTRIDPDVVLGRDVTLEPGVQLRGATRVGDDVLISTGSILGDCMVGDGVGIGAGCMLRSVDVAPGAVLKPYTVADGINEKRPHESADIDRVTIGSDARIGPFAHLRMRSTLADHVHVGNFVETKNTVLHDGAKANHLAYLGDGDIGAAANVGAGVIFCNYDGLNKNRTTIGADAFVGSDSQLVAPVTVGRRAYVGSGTTVTRDVPDGALMVTRARPKVLEGAGDRKYERIAAARAARAKKKEP